MADFGLRLATKGTSEMEIGDINRWSPDTREFISVDGKFKFIGKPIDCEHIHGAVFEVESPEGKLLVWNGVITNGDVLEFFVETSNPERRYFDVTGRMVVQGNKVIEISNVELNEVPVINS